MIKNQYIFLIITILFVPACGKKTISKMDYQELKTRKQELAEQQDTETMIIYLQKMVPLCEDLQELRGIMLELADLLFDSGKLEESEKLYREFSRLYPSDKNAEYALYKAILCCFYKTLDPTRDQTKTEEALELAQQFLQRDTLFTNYTDEVKKIVHTCNEKLAQSELNVIDFYIKRSKYTSANHRINTYKKEWLEKAPQTLVDILYYEYQLAYNLNQQETVVEKQAILQTKFPEHPLTLAAHKSLKQSMAHRF